MTHFFQQLGAGLTAIALAVSSFFTGAAPIVQPPTDNLAATNAIETPVALFETSLANSITSSATSMTLTSATTKNGTALASSTYSFIIDEGTASEEFVIADCTSTACTNMQRGLSVLTGTTTVASLQKAHRRGASVKITDAPILLKVARIVNGIGTFPNTLHYTNSPSSIGSDLTAIPDVNYVNNLSYTGAPDSSATVKGVVEKATAAEAASGAADGSGNTTAPLALTTSIATSTCKVATPSVIVASTTTGKIDQNCIDQSANYTWTGNATFSGGTVALPAGATAGGVVISPDRFGGNGSDGALSITSGTTTVNLGGASVFVKNYSSISITGTGALAFSNPASTGTTIILKSSGAITLTSSAVPNIDVSGMGAAGGSGGAVASDGTDGTQAVGIKDDTTTHYGHKGLVGVNDTTGGSASTGGTVYGNLFMYANATTTVALSRMVNVAPGSGGGGGGGGKTTGTQGAGGDGGRGGGALIIEAASTFNMTGQIWARGSNGSAGTATNFSNGSAAGGGGGGGAAGFVVVLYDTLTAASGTISTAGGVGGAGGDATGGSSGGGSSGAGGSGGSGGGALGAGGAGGAGGANTTGSAGSGGGTRAGGGGGGGAGRYNSNTNGTYAGGAGGAAGSSENVLIMPVSFLM